MRPATTWFILFCFLLTTTGFCATLTVGHGPGFDSPTVTAAIESANEGNTLLIAEGVYDSTHGETFPLNLKAGLCLVSADPERHASLVGDASGPVVTLKNVYNCLLNGIRVAGGRARFGGGILVELSSLTLRNCVLEENEAVWSEEARQGGGGSAVYSNSSVVSVENCWIRENLSSDLGSTLGFTGTGSATVEGSTITRNLGGVVVCTGSAEVELACCLVSENASQGLGGRGVVETSNSSHARLANCSVVANEGIGVRAYSSSTIEVRNCILWNHFRETIFGGVDVSDSCVRGALTLSGILSAWPEFRNPSQSDWRLADQSPCIDAGDSSHLDADQTEDLDGNPRIQREGVDMGAYETAPEYEPGYTLPYALQLHVRPDSPSAKKTGESWEDAFTTIREALFRATKGSTLWVAGGLYREYLHVIDGIEIYGGFEGSEIALEDRPNPLSPTVVDATGFQRTVVQAQSGDGFLLDGFVLTGGEGLSGGALYVEGVNTTIRNCTLERNFAANYDAPAKSRTMATTIRRCPDSIVNT